jgi:hypothetical protein
MHEMRRALATALVLSSACAAFTQQHLSDPSNPDPEPKCEVSNKWALDAGLTVISAAAAVAGIVLSTGNSPSTSDVAAGGVLGAAGGVGTLLFGISAINGLTWNGECERATQRHHGGS